MHKREGRTYTKDFKQQMVNLYNAGKPGAEVIREYGLTPSAFDTWLRRSKTTGSFAEKDNRMPEQVELLKLCKQNAQLIAKKAVLTVMPEWNSSMPTSRSSVFIVVRLMGVLKKHKRIFLIIFIGFTIGNESAAPSRISHLFKWKKLHNRSLSTYPSHFFGQKSWVNYFRVDFKKKKKHSKKCVSDIDFIPI